MHKCVRTATGASGSHRLPNPIVSVLLTQRYIIAAIHLVYFHPRYHCHSPIKHTVCRHKGGFCTILTQPDLAPPAAPPPPPIEALTILR